ncbi:flagellar biosynthesis protein FlhA [Clostridium aminobutyricum]|uniref:Flagellar biosynthesis protein FlhA n=1 Tax=Clostridium aminobutyricum TaxID=33953 RepID=A0A939IJ44_CLOAM|nr:flagellar biosynthesis protein FlhA [Clostridium aminobutyricum]MBN7773726.1 flagellar biosynthesis protein FlhA [Clostridium aminobutyricum]
MRKLLDNVVALFVVMVVVMFIVPLSPFLLDMLFVINITIALIILLMTMYIKETLEFSIFPSLLLVTTLFRLALNISSTRLILTHQGEAGQVIATFGKFVLQGNIVVGVLIFLILVLVQFIVITKGAERVAEVAARFTLDAMPGKQMAIDADLSSGLINEEDARLRRIKIQRESDFYGAMDGATKIVKGDAIMSIIIVLVNFIAGTIIGLVQGGMPFSEVLEIYSIATIGDGLVSQMPALLISTATGMIVTRSVAEGTLNEDVLKQFLSQPRVLIAAGITILAMIIIPGAPFWQPVIMGTFLIVLGLRLLYSDKVAKKQLEAEEVREVYPEEQFDENAYFKDINNIYSLINVEPIEMEFGYSLIPLVDETSGGNLINRIVIFRRQFAQEMGFVVPSVRLRDSAALNANQYSIKLKGEEIAKGELLVDYYLALEPPNATGDIDGIRTIEPAYGIPSKWILPELKDMAEIYGYTVIDPLSVMLTHLSEIIRRHAHELLTRAEIMQIVENAKKSSPELVEEAIPNVISYGTLQKVLYNLLKEGVPIKDMVTVVESLLDTVQSSNDIDVMTENVRTALKRTITRRFCESGQLMVVTLDSEVEKAILSSLTRSEHGVYLALSPDLIQKIVTQLGEHLGKFKELNTVPIILTSNVIRVYFYRLIEQFYPNVYVLAFNEVASNVQIQALGNISM